MFPAPASQRGANQIRNFDLLCLIGLAARIPLGLYAQVQNGVISCLERSLARQMSVSLNDVGGHGAHLPMNIRSKDLQPACWGPVGDPGGTQTAYLKAQVPNPSYGASGIQNGSVGVSCYDIGSTTYNALQAAWLVTRPDGLTGSVCHVWSKLLGNVSDLTNGLLNPTGNPGIQNLSFLHQNEHSNLATEVPHRVSGIATCPLPFGRGKRFGSTMPGWANQLAGGSTVTSIKDVSSGFPIGMSVSGTPRFAGNRPMYMAGVSPLASGSTHNRLGGQGQMQGYLRPAAFALPKAFQLGDVPRSAARLRGQFSFDDNVSVIKSFPMRDTMRLGVRAEAFNVLNKVQSGMPSATLGSASFGTSSSQANLTRNMQMSA